jgi:hypothetical protein
LRHMDALAERGDLQKACPIQACQAILRPRPWHCHAHPLRGRGSTTEADQSDPTGSPINAGPTAQPRTAQPANPLVTVSAFSLQPQCRGVRRPTSSTCHIWASIAVRPLASVARGSGCVHPPRDHPYRMLQADNHDGLWGTHNILHSALRKVTRRQYSESAHNNSAVEAGTQQSAPSPWD